MSGKRSNIRLMTPHQSMAFNFFLFFFLGGGGGGGGGGSKNNRVDQIVARKLSINWPCIFPGTYEIIDSFKEVGTTLLLNSLSINTKVQPYPYPMCFNNVFIL